MFWGDVGTIDTLFSFAHAKYEPHLKRGNILTSKFIFLYISSLHGPGSVNIRRNDGVPFYCVSEENTQTKMAFAYFGFCLAPATEHI